MQCQTVKVGKECTFWATSGCTYIGRTCYPVVESCEGCNRILTLTSGRYCSSYADPRVKWEKSSCNFGTHVQIVGKVEEVKMKNPLKASKKAAGAGKKK
jgi:hypothetical protein